MTFELEVSNIREFKRFLDSEIGTEYQVIERNKFDWGGVIVVYDVTQNEKQKIKDFLK